MAASKEEEDRAVVVAVVQWEIQGKSKEDVRTAASKIRIRKRDLKGETYYDEGVCRGRNLLKAVRDELISKYLDRSMDDEQSSELEVDIYDETQSSYISLTKEEILLKTDITKRFGSRLKLSVRYIRDKNQKYSEDGLKAIMGRFYPYDPTEGLLVAGKRLIVQELSNQQNAGTGVNLWDGALLL